MGLETWTMEAFETGIHSLAGGLEYFLFFHVYIYIVGNNHPIPADVQIFQRGGPTTNQIMSQFLEETKGIKGHSSSGDPTSQRSWD